MTRINVIVPTYRRPEYLNRTLACLATQRTTASYEVLVVDDDGVDPRPREVVSFWSKRAPIRYLTPGPGTNLHGRTRIRNFGISQAKCEIIVFLDDDMLVTSEFIEEHSQAHERTGGDTVVIGYRNHLKVSSN